MKKTTLFLIAISLLFSSCGKDPKNEWERFYGFTQADIIGHFEANPDESLYQELPTEGAVVYDNAVIDIISTGNNIISVHIVIPGNLNKTFSGPLDMSDENRSDIALLNVINSLNKEDLMMTVYKNEKGQVRFHGRVKRYYYEINSAGSTVLKRSDNWGFDVIKQ